MGELHREGDSSTLSEGKLASGVDSAHNSWQTEIEVTVVYPKVASCGEATGVCEWCSGERLVGVRVLCKEETVETWMWCRGACTERGRMPGRQGLDVIRTRQTKVREVQEGLLSGK